MDNLLTVAFEAHHDGNNHHRRYEVVLGRDLLEDWTLTVRYGRVGRVSQERRCASSEASEVRVMIRDRLLRRLSAPRRIGCPYRLATLHAAPDFNPDTWLPGEVMARFFRAAGITSNVDNLVSIDPSQSMRPKATLSGIARNDTSHC